MEKYENLEKLTKGEYSKNYNLRIITQKFIQFYISTFAHNIKKEKISDPNLSTIRPLINNKINFGQPISTSLFSDKKQINSPKKKSCNFSFHNSSPIKAYPNFNDKKIIIIYDTYKNFFYLYGNNRYKKRFSASECKFYGSSGSKMKLCMNFFKNDYYNKTHKTKRIQEL